MSSPPKFLSELHHNTSIKMFAGNIIKPTSDFSGPKYKVHSKI